MKKLMLLAVSFALLAVMTVTAGGKKETSAAAGAGGAASLFASGAIKPNTFANMTDIVKLPLTSTGHTFTVMGWEDSSMTKPRSEFLTNQELEKRTNVKIEWKGAPGENYTEYFTGVFAAGTNLPDMAIVEGDWGKAVRNISEFAAAGMIVPLENLIVKNAPNLKAFLDRRPDIRKLITAPDGHIYTIPSISMGDIMFYSHVVRQDWLDRLKLKVPDTQADWMAVLKAFRDNDPNGNGKQDEIQMILGGPSGVIEWGPFKAGYGLLLSYGGGWSVDGNKVTYAWLSPLAKDYITFMKRLYTEKLVRPEEFDDPDFPGKWGEYFFGGLAGIAAHWNWYINPEGIYKQMSDPAAKWTAVPDPVGPTGLRVMENTGILNANNFVMTKDCDDKDLAMKWIDYWYASKSGWLLMANGIENETWKMVDGRPMAILETASEDIKKKWEGTLLPDAVFPWIQLEDMHWLHLKDANVQAYLAKNQKYVFNTSALNAVMATADEAGVIAQYWDGLWAYQNEMIASFVTGKEPMENWDAFVAQLKKLGAEEVTKVKQAQFDRVR